MGIKEKINFNDFMRVKINLKITYCKELSDTSGPYNTYDAARATDRKEHRTYFTAGPMF